MNLQALAQKIKKNIQNEFHNIHLTGNLMNTIKIYPQGKAFVVEIPAERYDFSEWNKNGVIVYNGTGSYAEEVNERGGFSKSHKQYVENAIKDAIIEQMQEEGLRGNIKYE